jgi:serine/threonine-protein kinase
MVNGGGTCAACREQLLDARIGQTIDGRYELLEIVGSGGFGAVYRARHLALGGEIAVKFLLEGGARTSEVRARFRREAEILGRLRHPGIVSAVDFGEDAGDPYLVMELVQGTPLSKLVVRRDDAGAPRLMTKERVIALLVQLLEVLEAAHAAGVVHRDLKPDNVMVLSTEPEHVKVLDFGLALVESAPGQERLTATHAIQGTACYMSPEQCRGRDVGPPADVYAVGAILFECLTGDPPFVNGGFAEILAQHLFVDVPPAIERGLKRPVDPALEAIAQQALSKAAEARPTAHAFRESLLAALEGRDAQTLASNAASQRVAVGALTRDERALGGAPVRPEAATLPEAGKSLPPHADGPRVALWGLEGSRSDTLRTQLAMTGIVGFAWSDEAPPPAAREGHATAAVIVPGRDRTRLERLRASPEVGKLPALAIDILAAGDVTPLIRAGASDAVLSAAGSEAIGQKLWRMIRRKR